MTEGRIIAGPHVRAACARHLRDLARQGTPPFPYVWSIEKCNRILEFFEVVLRLDGGQGEPKPFRPVDWQAFILGSLFGWVHKDTGFRRFRTAYVETGKGSGKSPLAGGIGLYMMMADGERRAEVYAAAVDKEQAGILFRDAVSMSKLSPAIDSRVTRSGGEGREFNIAFLETGSFFRPISSESTGRGKSGYRPHCVLLDEIHEHPSNAMVEFMRAGIKGRAQPLIFMITNSGVDRTSVCFEYHTYGIEVVHGTRQDEEFFAYICALDEGDDPFTDPIDKQLGYPRSWAKANPSLGITFQKGYLEGQVLSAKGMPGKESIVRRLNFCQWVDADDPWIERDLWLACEVEELPDLSGRRRYLGLDLSSKRDLLAMSEVFEPAEDGIYYARVTFWTPADTLRERASSDRVPYDAWVRGGHLIAVPGRSIDYEYIARHVAELLEEGEIAALAFDQWRIDDFLRELSELGVDAWLARWDEHTKQFVDPATKRPGTGIMLRKHGQGTFGGASTDALWMPRSISVLEDLVVQGRLRVLSNPVLRYCSASAVQAQDPAGNKRWEKRRSKGRIDGIVALTMAVGCADAMLSTAPPPPPRVSFLEDPILDRDPYLEDEWGIGFGW